MIDWCDGLSSTGVSASGKAPVGGETCVFPADSGQGVRFTLAESWSALLLDDARVVHETTPIQSATTEAGWRDTLVLTYRAAGFQSPGDE